MICSLSNNVRVGNSNKVYTYTYCTDSEKHAEGHVSLKQFKITIGLNI